MVLEVRMVQGRRGKRRKTGGWALWLALVLAAGMFLFVWGRNPEHFREQKALIRSWISGEFSSERYDAKSMLMLDLSDGEAFIAKRDNARELPASLAKLFTIAYAETLADKDAIVPVSPEALALTASDSSVAGIEPREYYLRNLFAAMLVPSGNDAAYAVADYCGGLLAPDQPSGEARVRVFMDGLRTYLREHGYRETSFSDPAGYDAKAYTTASELARVTESLLKEDWFRRIVCQSSYTAGLPDGSIQTWENTNAFLDPESSYYNKRVIGVKTGSWDNDFNLIALYRQYNREFLIVSLGSDTDDARYDDVSRVLHAIDASRSLRQETG